MKAAFVVRMTAVLLLVSVLVPSYSSEAAAEKDIYIGSPLPFFDWVVAAAVVGSIVQPRFALPAGLLGFIHALLVFALLYTDAAEGPKVSILLGLPLAVVASTALLIAYRRMQSLNVKSSQPGVHRGRR